MLFMILTMVSGIFLVAASFLLASSFWQSPQPVRVEEETEIKTRRRS